MRASVGMSWWTHSNLTLDGVSLVAGRAGQASFSKVSLTQASASLLLASNITTLTTLPFRLLSTMAEKQPASRTAASATSHVRRNLFHHHLSRRPTSASTSTTATTLFESPQDDSSDIVMRDKNGNYQVEIPSKPVVDDETLPEDSGREKKGKIS